MLHWDGDDEAVFLAGPFSKRITDLYPKPVRPPLGKMTFQVVKMVRQSKIDGTWGHILESEMKEKEGMASGRNASILGSFDDGLTMLAARSCMRLDARGPVISLHM
jgi:hypothetical protein